ncbi:MAG: hypothetical protein BWY09_02393 [Candidatus Hydrogenedentes bacterium ADurb.Bin179]|nr:MAG: hypothetical protein BWY09_02393 [Candidatus Hydrogenedentes bacterium ADurb.Bin179]
MTSLMISGYQFFFGTHDHAATGGSHHNTVFGIIQVPHCDLVRIIAGGKQCGFIYEVRQVRPGKARRAPGHNVDVDFGVQGDFLVANMNIQNIVPPFNVWIGHDNLPVKTARPQQRMVQHIRSVRGRHQDNAIVGVKSVHLDQQLIQRLFPFIVSATEASPALTAHGVNFVNEYNTWGVFMALLKQVTHAACPHADEHFHKIRTANAEKGHVSLACNSLREKRLARARRPDQQHAARNLPPQSRKLLRLLQKLYDFLEFFLGLLHARHILEGNFLISLARHPGAAFAKRKGFVVTSLHLTEHKKPKDPENKNQGQEIKKHSLPQGIFNFPFVGNALYFKLRFPFITKMVGFKLDT